MTPNNCPKCKTPWKEDETIFDFFLRKCGNEEKALKMAENYGCTLDSPQHFSKDVIGIEIQGGYDGVSLWKCKKCNSEFDRWTLKEVKN